MWSGVVFFKRVCDKSLCLEILLISTQQECFKVKLLLLGEPLFGHKGSGLVEDLGCMVVMGQELLEFLIQKLVQIDQL
jgi:hypothetical protein